MDVVTCSCANCGAHVGDFENLWDQIGKRHFSPVCLKRKNWNITLQHSGDVRIAPTETAIEDRSANISVFKLAIKPSIPDYK
jgi:hypothetical protein